MTSNNGHSAARRFDVREYARTARGNHREDISISEYSDSPLSKESLHAVRYLGRLESATMNQLRNLLVTATHKDARVTAFLVTWAFEKFWIADALDAVLEAHGAPRAQATDEGSPRLTRTESVERRGPIRRAILAIGQGVPVIGVHMTMGLVDEWVTRSAYERLASFAASPALSATIGTILAVKLRHAEFFEEEARRRLTESSKAVGQTRRVLTRQAWPIGAIDRAAIDRTFFDTYVFGGAEGLSRAQDIGARASALPGMDTTIGTAISSGLTP